MVLLANNAASTLSASVANGTATTFTVADGSRFPSPTGGDYAALVVVDTTTSPETIKEFCHLTARSGNTLTVTRAAEDATTYPAGALASGLTVAVIASAQAIPDVATVVSNAPVSYFSSGSSTPGGVGVMSWLIQNNSNYSGSPNLGITGSVWYTVTNGDLSNGQVTLRLRHQNVGGVSAALSSTLMIGAKNLGPAAA